MARFVKFIGVHGEVAVNAERVLYAAPLPETGDCWLYFGGKGEAEEGHPAVIVVQVKGSLDDVVEKLEAPGKAADDARRRDAQSSLRGRGHDEDRDGGGRASSDDDERPPLQAAAEDEPPLLPPPE